ncbi:MFS transporter [Tardisphaera miroshnichenkoae]
MDDGLSKRNIILLFASRALRSFAAGFMGVIIGLYLLHVMGLSPVIIGALFAVGAISTPAISLAVGRLGDVYGRKVVLILDMLTLPLGIAILLTSKNVYLLGLSMAIGGFGMAGGLVGGGVGASVAPVLTALLAENTDGKNRTKVYSLNSQINTFAGAAGAAIISFMGYRQLFEFGLVLSLISVLVILPLRERFTRPAQGQSGTAQLSDSDKKFIKIFAYTGLLNGAGMGLVTPFLPIIFNQFFGMRNSQIGFLMSAGGIISGIAFSFTPYLAKRMGLVNLIVITRGVASALTFMIPFSPSAILASALYLISTPIRMVSLPAQSSLQMSLIGEGNRSTASGLNQAARQFPQAVSTIVAGALISVMPLYVPFALATAFNYANVYLYERFFAKLPGAKGIDK